MSKNNNPKIDCVLIEDFQKMGKHKNRYISLWRLVAVHLCLFSLTAVVNGGEDISTIVWDTLSADIPWRKYIGEKQFCKIKLFQGSEAKIVQFLGASKEERSYNCAQVYQYCIEERVGTRRCAATASKVIKHIEPFGCKKDGRQCGNDSFKRQFFSPLLSVDKDILNVLPITFVVLGDSTRHSRQREIDILNGWGKFEDVIFIHNENKANRLFPLLTDLVDYDSPNFRPCSSIFFFVKSDTFVNTTSIKSWLSTMKVTSRYRPLYAGSSHLLENSCNNNDEHILEPNEDITYNLKCTNSARSNAQISSLPYANWDSGILLNKKSVELITSEIALQGATNSHIQRAKHQYHDLFFCYSHGSNNIQRLAKCLFNNYGVRLTQFPEKSVMKHPVSNCQGGLSQRQIPDRTPLNALTVRASSAKKPCYNPSCGTLDCIDSLRHTIESTLFLVPTCARYIHRFIAWLKHINITSSNLITHVESQEIGVKQSQIFTILSSSDNVTFVKHMLAAAGLIYYHHENDA